MSDEISKPETPNAEDSLEGYVGPERRKLPTNRNCVTCKVHVAGHEGYIVAGMYEDGSLGEVFLHGFGKEGSTLEGWTQVAAILFSVARQYGAPLDMVARKIAHMKFEPYGLTNDPRIPWVPSMPAYIFAWLACRFGSRELEHQVLQAITEARTL